MRLAELCAAEIEREGLTITEAIPRYEEYGRNAPSRRTMSALLEVPELGLTLADLPGMGTLRASQDAPAASDDREASAELNFLGGGDSVFGAGELRAAGDGGGKSKQPGGAPVLLVSL